MPAPERTPHALLRHLDSLYHVARLLTPSPREASVLVETTGRRALQRYGSDASEVDRAALLHLLLEVHAERSDLTPGTRVPNLEAGLHRRLAHHYLQRALPPALAALPGSQQLLILLTEVEELDVPEAGRVLDVDTETASEQLRAAHRMLRDALYRQASEAERELLRDHATPHAVADGLRHLLRSERSTVPPRLRKTMAKWAEPEPSTPQTPAPGPEPNDDEVTDGDRRFHRALIGVLLVLAAGLAGWLATELLDRPQDVATLDLLQQTAQHASAVQPTLETGDAARAEAYALETTGQRVDVPAIRGTELLGAGTDEVAPGVRVPVFLYRGAEDVPSVALYTYSYSLLDRVTDRLRLAPDVRRRIEDEQRYGNRAVDDQHVLVWRRRDDIYVAVTEDEAADLQERLEWPEE